MRVWMVFLVAAVLLGPVTFTHAKTYTKGSSKPLIGGTGMGFVPLLKSTSPHGKGGELGKVSPVQALAILKKKGKARYLFLPSSGKSISDPFYAGVSLAPYAPRFMKWSKAYAQLNLQGVSCNFNAGLPWMAKHKVAVLGDEGTVHATFFTGLGRKKDKKGNHYLLMVKLEVTKATPTKGFSVKVEPGTLVRVKVGNLWVKMTNIGGYHYAAVIRDTFNPFQASLGAQAPIKFKMHEAAEAPGVDSNSLYRGVFHSISLHRLHRKSPSSK